MQLIYMIIRVCPKRNQRLWACRTRVETCIANRNVAVQYVYTAKVGKEITSFRDSKKNREGNRLASNKWSCIMHATVDDSSHCVRRRAATAAAARGGVRRVRMHQTQWTATDSHRLSPPSRRPVRSLAPFTRKRFLSLGTSDTELGAVR